MTTQSGPRRNPNRQNRTPRTRFSATFPLERLTVTVRMVDGSKLEGPITHFDRFALVIGHAGSDHMIFKHAIAAIKTPKKVASYLSPQ